MQSYHITFEAFHAAQRLHMRRARRIGKWLALTLIAVLVFTPALIHGIGWHLLLGLIPLTVAWLAIDILLPIFDRIMHKRTYNSQQTLAQEIHVDFDNEAVHWRSKSGSCTLAWTELYGYRGSPQLYLLYEAPNLLRMVPAAAFETAEERQVFEGHLTTHVKKLG